MRDLIDARVWADNHEAFSDGIDRALGSLQGVLHRFGAWDGSSHQLLALVLSFAITALTFNATTTS